MFKDISMIDFAYPCVTYIARRLGLSSEDIVGLAHQLGPFYHPDMELIRGDILLWTDYNKRDYKHKPLYIEKGKVLFAPVLVNIRFALYEGNHIVSDCIIEEGYIPIIRTYKIYEAKSYPSIVIREYNERNNKN